MIFRIGKFWSEREEHNLIFTKGMIFIKYM